MPVACFCPWRPPKQGVSGAVSERDDHVSRRKGRWFESNRGSHIGATILHPNTKLLVNQGLFVFLGKKQSNVTITPFHRSVGLEPVTFSCHALRDKFPCSVGRHLVQNMI